jgi:hypothetical protein
MITIEQAKKLNTKRLLAYYRKLPHYEIDRHYYDGCTCSECSRVQDMLKYRREIKALLDERENVE